jgi:hypothetical protein
MSGTETFVRVRLPLRQNARCTYSGAASSGERVGDGVFIPSSAIVSREQDTGSQLEKERKQNKERCAEHSETAVSVVQAPLWVEVRNLKDLVIN